MSNPTPLFIVVGTIAILMLIQHLLMRATARKEGQISQPPKRATPALQGPLFTGISITGLDSRGITRLRSHILAGDLAETTIFLAFNGCTVPLLDQYLDQIRARLHAQRPKHSGDINHITLKTLFDDSMLPPAPMGMHFDTLSNTEQLDLLSFNRSKPRAITRDLMARFGGHSFHSNFAEYCKHQQDSTLYIPNNDPRRPTFEKLAEAGIAEKGRDIPLGDRLTLLTLRQLQHMAKDLNLKQEFKDKHEAIAALADKPGTRVLFSMQYVVDELFHLKPISENDEQIKHEWGYLQAYAKLLLSIPDKSIPPDTMR